MFIVGIAVDLGVTAGGGGDCAAAAAEGVSCWPSASCIAAISCCCCPAMVRPSRTLPPGRAAARKRTSRRILASTWMGGFLPVRCRVGRGWNQTFSSSRYQPIQTG